MSNKDTTRKKIPSIIWILLPLLLLSIGAVSCKNTYLGQAVVGHFKIMNARVPIDKILKSDDIDQETKNQLQLVLDIQKYAVSQLSLPAGKSYTVYAEIEEEYPGWNVFAAPPYSMVPKTWCYPIAGCVVYHGYFTKDKAFNFAEEMKEEGYDTYTSPFTAYSTLGWFKDPILSNHLRYDSIRLAGLIIHELAHQRFYQKGNSTVSESFAVTVERAGVLHWLKSMNRLEQKERAQQQWEREDRYIKRLLQARNSLDSLYTEETDTVQLSQTKARILEELHRDIGVKKDLLNNAFLVPVGAYNDLVPEFTAVLDSLNGNFERFFEHMENRY